MADKLQEIAWQDEKKNEISLKEIEQAFYDISSDNKNNDIKQINKLVELFEKDIDKYDFAPENIIKEIFTDHENFSEITEDPNTIKVYQLCKRLEDKKERNMNEEMPQELIKDWIEEKKNDAGLFSTESLEYDDENKELIIKTPFGEHTIAYQSWASSDFSQIVDNENNMEDFIKEQRVILFDTFIQTEIVPAELENIQAITLSEDGVMSLEMWDIDMEIYVKDTTNISEMTAEDVVWYIHSTILDFKNEQTERTIENTQLQTILQKTTFTEEDMDVINNWNTKNRKVQPKTTAKLKEKMNSVVDEISTKKSKEIAYVGNKNVYTTADIKMIQLRANVSFWQNLDLDGDRWVLFYSSENTDNQKKTNIYIYQHELITRKEIIDNLPKEYENLLDIPKLEELLKPLWNVDKQNEVFEKFLDFYLDILRSGKYFENIVTGEALQTVLNYMILAETEKDIFVEEYFKDMEENSKQNKIFKESIIAGWYTTMYDYYLSMSEIYKDVNIEDFIKSIEDPIEQEINRKEFEKKWYEFAGEYYNDLLANIDDESKKSMSVDNYFKDQETNLEMLLSLKSTIKWSTMWEYYNQQAIALQS